MSGQVDGHLRVSSDCGVMGPTKIALNQISLELKPTLELI